MHDTDAILREHKMEQRANVYLRLDAHGRWVVDDVFVQAGPVDGLTEGPDGEGCSCDDMRGDNHLVALTVAREATMPDPMQLLRLMIDALFPHDTPPALTDRATIEAWLADPDTKGPRLT